MLTEDQKGVIESSSFIGDIKYLYEGKSYFFAKEQILDAVAEAFKDKTAPADKEATIIIGALGVGKTHFADEFLQALPQEKKSATVYVGHYEDGAAQHLEPFHKEFYSADNGNERLALVRRFDPAISSIVKGTLARAREQNFSLLLDIDGTPEAKEYPVEYLRASGYGKITIASIHTSFDIASSRAEDQEKFWPTDMVDLVKKRIESLAVLPGQPAKSDQFDFYVNNYTNMPAQKTFSIQPLSAPLIMDATALQGVCEDLSEDIRPIKDHLKRIKKDALYKGRVDVDQLMTDYTAAVQTAGDFLKEVLSKGEILPPATRFSSIPLRLGPSRDR